MKSRIVAAALMAALIGLGTLPGQAAEPPFTAPIRFCVSGPWLTPTFHPGTGLAEIVLTHVGFNHFNLSGFAFRFNLASPAMTIHLKAPFFGTAVWDGGTKIYAAITGSQTYRFGTTAQSDAANIVTGYIVLDLTTGAGTFFGIGQTMMKGERGPTGEHPSQVDGTFTIVACPP